MVVCLAGQNALSWWRILLGPSHLFRNNYLRLPCKAVNQKMKSKLLLHDHEQSVVTREDSLTDKYFTYCPPLQCQTVTQYQQGRKHNTSQLLKSQPLSYNNLKEGNTVSQEVSRFSRVGRSWARPRPMSTWIKGMLSIWAIFVSSAVVLFVGFWVKTSQRRSLILAD